MNTKFINPDQKEAKSVSDFKAKLVGEYLPLVQEPEIIDQLKGVDSTSELFNVLIGNGEYLLLKKFPVNQFEKYWKMYLLTLILRECGNGEEGQRRVVAIVPILMKLHSDVISK